jgi:HEAT repeat protein
MNADTLRKNKSLFFIALGKLKEILNQPITWEQKPQETGNLKDLFNKSLRIFLPDKKSSEEKQNVSCNKDAKLFNEFVESLSGDHMPYARKNAAISLGRLGDKRAIEYLTRALGDENIEVRMSAASSLGQLGDEKFIDKLIEALKDSNNYLRDQAARVLVSVGEKAVKPLINTLKSDDWMLPYLTVTILGRIGNPEAIRALIDLLEDEGNIYVYKASIEAMEKIGIQAETELLKAFNNKPIYVKEKILNILSKTGGEKTIEKLNKSIEKEHDERFKKCMEECVKTIRKFRVRKN